MNTEKFEIVAKTFQGLEDVLAEELKNLGAEDIEIGRRMVSFHGDKTLLLAGFLFKKQYAAIADNELKNDV